MTVRTCPVTAVSNQAVINTPKAPRRTLTTEYQAAPFGEKSAVLRREGRYRKEIDRLNRRNAQLEKQLTQTEAALEIMGKLHVPLESISESTGTMMPPATHSTSPSTNSAPPRSRQGRRAH
ncbi:hypothetical protein LQL77_31100 [Rhodococcus cerastii]|nr:hypothetical protein [Rhodococcus cerastii]